jgi:hypothetical protein
MRTTTLANAPYVMPYEPDFDFLTATDQAQLDVQEGWPTLG